MHNQGIKSCLSQGTLRCLLPLHPIITACPVVYGAPFCVAEIPKPGLTMSIAGAGSKNACSNSVRFFALMFVIWAWATSVSSAEGFAFVQQQMAGPLGKFVAIGTISALIYHVLGGIRHMIMDLGHWEELQSGDISAKAIIAAWIILTILVGVVLC